MIIKDKHNQAFIEKDCEITVQNKVFSSGGAWIMKRKDNNLFEGVLYLYRRKIYNKKNIHTATQYFVGTWDGNKKVQAVKLNEWINNYGDIRQHFYFIWEGVKFWGINYGDNDIVRCKQYKNQ
jgi:hypothetical protein